MKTKEPERNHQDEGDHHHLITGHFGGHDCLPITYNVLPKNVDKILLQFPGSHKSNREFMIKVILVEFLTTKFGWLIGS